MLHELIQTFLKALHMHKVIYLTYLDLNFQKTLLIFYILHFDVLKQ